ncbi:lysine/arginine/ornithine ABC transporter substrate-binding protein [Coralliovum pocilloporae]|uniref:lysine/arginine/ornithine ABC transporter substrate-binding protein n=1 Tax=Coralliovum pocilloporae TaxID=3066369 RepID=UPI003306B9BF
MVLFKKLALAASALVVAISVAEAKDWKKIRIGTEGAYPPFNNLTSDGKLEGFDIDIARALCEKMGAECEFVTQDWDGIIPALVANKYDAIIASMSITDERKKQISFSEKYYNTPPALAVPKDSDLTAGTADALKGRLVGAQSSTTHGNYAEQFFGEGSEVKLYPTADEYKLDLASGRIDVVVDDIVVLSEWLATEEGSCCKILTPLESVVAIHGEGAGIGVRKEDQDLADAFSKAIKEIREDGTYQKINAKYFAFDVY